MCVVGKYMNCIMKRRILLIDNLKAFLIFMVVFGHSLELLIDYSSFIGSIYRCIYVFHMPAFFFISGYLSKNIQTTYNTAFRTCMIPYVLTNILWCILFQNFKFNIFSPSWGSWFLLSLFFMRIMMPVLKTINLIVPSLFFFALYSGCIEGVGGIISLSRTICMLPFFVVGFFTSEEVVSKVRHVNKLLCFGLLLLLIVISYHLFNDMPFKFLYFIDSYRANNIGYINGIIFRCSAFVIALAEIFCTMNLISDKKSFITEYGKKTVIIYLLHFYFLRMARILIVKFDLFFFILDNIYTSFILMFLFSILLYRILGRDSLYNVYNNILDRIESKVLSKDFIDKKI